MGTHVGLDIGIASVGWAVLDPESCEIKGLGVRTFRKAEDPKTGASLALPRRLARSSRRRLHRRRARMQDFRELLTSSGMIAPDDLSTVFTPIAGDTTPYQLRAEGLDRLLTEIEWARVLSQICKRRGYRSMKQTTKESAKDDDGVVKAAIAQNAAHMSEHKYRTAGEMLWLDERFQESRRNKGDYRAVVSRELVLDEVAQLFAAQRTLGNAFATPQIEETYLEILQTQASILEGDALRDKVGRCSIDRTNRRIPLACPTFERFRLVDKLHNVRYTLGTSGSRISLDAEQREVVIDKAFNRVTKLTYANIRKLCELPTDARFVGVRYSRDPDDLTAETKETIPAPKAWHEMHKALSECPPEVWSALSSDTQLLDAVAEILTYFKYDESIGRELKMLGLSDEAVDALAQLRFSGNGHLSQNTLRAILPHMEDGLPYSEACEAAGFHHSQRSDSERHSKLPAIPTEELRNPVVLRALTQTRKVLNAIIDEYGPIEQLHIELARDVARSSDDRKQIEKMQKENRSRNDSILDQLADDYGIERPRPLDIVKFKLWKEQGGRCAYSGAYIDPERMLSGEPGIAEVDHILPHSRSFDDGYMNKVLVTTAENRNKRERTPFEYLGGDADRLHEYEERVLSMHLRRPKQERLLRKDFDERASDEFRERNLIDTQYIARFFKSFVEDNLQFSGDSKAPVMTVNGRATAYLRTAWQLQKVRAEGDLHHALDAAVIAATTRSMVQKVSRFFSVRPLRNKNGEYFDPATGEIVPAKHVPEPWEGFASSLGERLSARFGEDPFGEIAASEFELQPILVSRMPNRTVRGEVHGETVKRIEGEDAKGRTVTSKKVRLVDLTAKTLELMVGRVQDRTLYEALKSRLAEFDGDAAKAFAEPFHKPTRLGRKAPLVRSVRISDKPSSGGTAVRGGLAKNGKMVRTDVFVCDGKYYLIPTYVKHTVADELPNMAIKAHKPESQWRKMDESYQFVFSLHQDDPIRLVRESCGMIVALSGYFGGTDRAAGAISIEATDSSWTKSGLGVAQSIVCLEKYQVDLLGRSVHVVKREKRCGFSDGGDKQ
ncbi:MAG: type II CRISPR RNA-guided endonuclease Cas9 [Actinomycetota bacterium]|nr:type II CRISPR RNA-guided endonuclease Cas9 [Actinomycetota bacterium]MDP3631287.1 type II CRISPR RNA-guided endonuclease Cas9 [Actinomycetota bacterium]